MSRVFHRKRGWNWIIRSGQLQEIIHNLRGIVKEIYESLEQVSSISEELKLTIRQLAVVA